jgi:uncharacterized protein (TIRG00374 family)
MKTTGKKANISWFRLLLLILLAIFVFVIISQIDSLKGSINQIKTSQLGYDLLAVIAIIISYLFSSLTYYVIALKPIRYWRTVIVQLGINTVNRLLPVGIGAIGGNFLYLKKAGHSNVQAASVVFINNLLGFIGNLLLLGTLLIFVPHAHFVHIASAGHVVGIIVFGSIVVSTAVLMVPRVRSRLIRATHNFLKQLKVYSRHKSKLPVGLICEIGLTLGSVMALSFSLKAVHGYLPLSSLMLAYSFAIWIGSIIPAPGGLGSVEAGLITALVTFGIRLDQALAAVLVFRLISFWLPLITGIPPLIWSRRKGYI